MERYEWNPADYAAHSRAQYQWAEEMIGKLDLNGTESILDIGCGDGKVTALLASRVPQGSVTAIDNSASMIRLAREKYPRSLTPNITFLEMDALDIPFINQFDLVFSNAALHWVPDHARMLRGVFRCLKRKGRVFFQMGGHGNASDILNLADAMIHSDPWKDYFMDFSNPYRFFTAGEYRVLLGDAGLIPIRAELIPKDMVQAGKEGLSGWIRTTWLPYTGRVPVSGRNRFISDLAESYLERYPPDSKGLVHIRMVRLEVEAHKP